MLPLLAVACSPSTAQVTDGHSLDPADQEPDPIAITAYTEDVQLFMEYPRFTVGEQARFLAHVTVLASGEPVRSGSIRLEIGPIDQPMTVLTADQPKRDGLFIPEGSFSTAGSFEARIRVDSPQAVVLIELPPIQVFADKASAIADADSSSAPEPADAVPFLLEQQWAIGSRMESVARRDLTKRLTVPGHIRACPESLVTLGAPVEGLLQAPEDGALPRLGSEVLAGQLLGYLEAPLTSSDRVQLETVRTDLLAREMELEAKQVEVSRALNDARAQVEFSSSALLRMQAVRAKGLGTEAELEAAARDHRLAEASLTGAEELQSSFAEAQVRLQEMRKSLVDSIGDSDGGGMRYPLIAPISGELVAVDAHAGESLDGQQSIFQILDASRVWVELEVSEFDLGELSDDLDARLTSTLFPRRDFGLLQDLAGTLVQVGRRIDPQDRTVEVVFEIDNPDLRFPLGLFVEAQLATSTRTQCVAIPESAVVRDLGLDVVYVVHSGETMQRREVELGLRDQGMVEVLSGLSEGERLIVEGAYRVKLASASPAELGHGHAH
ncbi:MAG: efflux RND transporter periplasmic adaptor subunit [Planctomycetota bacterium]